MRPSTDVIMDDIRHHLDEVERSLDMLERGSRPDAHTKTSLAQVILMDNYKTLYEIAYKLAELGEQTVKLYTPVGSIEFYLGK